MTSLIYSDTRQQSGKHTVKEDWWASHGIEIVRKKLDFGDYMTPGSNYSIDTKRNVAEIAQNIGGRGHVRFKNECIRARDAGWRLVVLVENANGYTCIKNVNAWTNDHCMRCAWFKARKCNPHKAGKCPKHETRPPIQGPRLAKAMNTMSERYGVRFEFCRPAEAARRICDLLGVAYE